MRRIQFLLSVLLLGLLLVACAPQAAPAPAPAASAPAAAPAPAPGAAGPIAPAKPAWEAEWERVLTEAKKERTVVLSSTMGPDVRGPLVTELKKAYGISLEVVSGRSAEANAKILAERRTGLYLWDITIGGTTTPYTDLEPVGALDPLDRAFIIPDVTDPALIKKIWYRGSHWWVDDSHLQLAFHMFPYSSMAINTNLIRPEEIKSYNDFLDPKWKGKMVMDDITLAGSTFGNFVYHTFGEDWMRRLAKNEPIMIRDQRLQGEWLSQGKVPIWLAVNAQVYASFKRVGAPIQVVVPAEGTWLSAGQGAVKIFNRPPHPNAAKVFINWMLTKEAQTLLSKLYGAQSTREDVPTDFLEPWQIRQPGVKYWEKETKDLNLRKADELKLFKELLAPIIK